GEASQVSQALHKWPLEFDLVCSTGRLAGISQGAALAVGSQTGLQNSARVRDPLLVACGLVEPSHGTHEHTSIVRVELHIHAAPLVCINTVVDFAAADEALLQPVV